VVRLERGRGRRVGYGGGGDGVEAGEKRAAVFAALGTLAG
jgi:hypothetical protein